MSRRRDPERAEELDPSQSPKPTCDETLDATAAELVRVLDEYLADLKAGKAPSREELIARHPALASQLEACLAGLEFIHGAETSGPSRAQRLGDFRIIREVGRGGMGAVFEAEQISLGRRVALKILRFGGVSNPEAIERFQREAETVAKLHHTNIVPIFAVGSERGVNYYAMQFIEGKSLGEVLAESDEPLPAEQVADWGLQAAEALEHAHERGVIHRDVKPSNLLLDHEQRLWLTDFGLARRLDDVTLSITGVLLGTPRYMSPEQAVASKRRIDHRTDLFSLGATLYELLTGKPAFVGDTPHDVIQNIIQCEPNSIRQINANVPRDLETIVMKCLAKEPEQRYSAARELANDLRAFLEGRPIRARRATSFELAVRWLRQHQRNVALTGAAAAITLLITIVGIFGWSGFREWQKGSIRLDAVNPPLVAEFLRPSGEVERVETLPMQSAASLPAGEYDIRVSADGILSQTFAVNVERGHSLNYTINLHDHLLLSPRDIDQTFAIVEFDDDQQALVLWTKEGMALQKRQGPQLGWSMKLGPEHSSAMQSAPGFRWPWTHNSVEHSGYGKYANQPWVARRALDVNGDGTGDLLCAGRHQAWIMAVSGVDGSVIWMAPRGEQLLQPVTTDAMYQSPVSSAVLGEPVTDHDCDGDRIADLIVTIVDIGMNPAIQSNLYSCKRWVEAVSGATGKTIWRYDLDDALFNLSASESVPYDMRWFGNANGGMSASGRGRMSIGRHLMRDRQYLERTGPHCYQPTAATRVQIAGHWRVALMAGTHVVLLDPSNGQAVEAPIDIRFRPGKPPIWNDVDGDGSTDLVMIEQLGPAGFAQIPGVRLAVWSYSRQKLLWSSPLDAYWPQQPNWTVDAPMWPLVVDLNADGKSEIIVPDGRSQNAGPTGRRSTWNATPWGSIAVRAGESGKPVWTRNFVSMDTQVDCFIDGPDIDGDGSSELYVITLAHGNFTVFVDCLSGATGKTLWSAQQVPRSDRGSSADFVLAPPKWWRSGVDGWPQLLVQAVDELASTRHSMIGAFSAGTGMVTHVGYGVTSATPADLDDDGLEDLLLFRSQVDSRLDFGGSLKCLRGLASQPWKRLGAIGVPIADLDGDGVRDLVRSWGDGTLLANNGATGLPLWRSNDIRSTSELIVRPASSDKQIGTVTEKKYVDGDLNGDGCVDLLAIEQSAGGRGSIAPMYAVSGRSGRRLWTIADVTAKHINGTLAAEAVDLDRDHKQEIVWLAALDYGYPERVSSFSFDVQLWLFVLEGHTGRVKWSQALSPQFGLGTRNTMPFHFDANEIGVTTADLDEDGTLDLFVPAIQENLTLELHALNGKTGKLLWKRVRQQVGTESKPLQNWTSPGIVDMDADGQREIVVTEPIPKTSPTTTDEVRVTALAANTGRELWSKPAGAAFAFFHISPTGRADALRPIPLSVEGGRQRIGIIFPGTKIMVFDSDGQAKERKLEFQSEPTPLWSCDADGNGDEEIVFVDQSTLYVVHPDNLDEPLWTFPLGTMGQQRILDILPASAAYPAPLIVLATDPTDNRVLGIHARNGRIAWSCAGPIPRDLSDDVYMVPNQIALLGARHKESPLVFYEFGFVAEVRQAVRNVDASSTTAESVLASFAPRGVAVATAKLGGVVSDARWKRDLPWRFDESTNIWRVFTFFAWAMFFSLTLLVIPGAFLLHVICSRSFSLRTLLILPVICSIALVAALIQAPADSAFINLRARLTIGLVCAPPILAFGILGWWLVTGRWKRAAVWLAVVVVVSTVLAIVSLLIHVQQSPLTADESFEFGGWYSILLAGAYLTSVILVILLAAAYLVTAILKYFARRRSSRIPTAGSIDQDNPLTLPNVTSTKVHPRASP